MKEELGNDAEEIMPTLVQKWIEQGIEQGIEKGALLKAIETCKKLLLMGLDPSAVSDATGLPIKKVLEIEKNLS